MGEFKSVQNILGNSSKKYTTNKPFNVVPEPERLDGVDNEKMLELFEQEMMEPTDYKKYKNPILKSPQSPCININEHTQKQKDICNIIQPNTHKLAVYDIGVLGQRILYYILKNFQSRYKNEEYLKNDNYTIDINWSEFTKNKGTYADYKKSLWKILSTNVMLEEKTPFINENGQQAINVEILALQLFRKLNYEDIYGSASATEKKRLRGIKITMTNDGYQFFRNLKRGYSQIDYDAIMSLKRYSSMRLYELISGFTKRGYCHYGFQKLKLALLQNVDEVDEDDEDNIELKEKKESNNEKNLIPNLFSDNEVIEETLVDEEDKLNVGFNGIKVKQYSSIYDFNRRVLNPAIAELKEKCPYIVDYEYRLNKNGDYLYTLFIKKNEKFQYQSYQEIITTEHRKLFDLRNIFSKKDLIYLVEIIGISKKELLNNLSLVLTFVEKYNNHQEGGKEFITWISKIYQVIVEKALKGNMMENPNGYIINCLKKELGISITE